MAKKKSKPDKKLRAQAVERAKQKSYREKQNVTLWVREEDPNYYYVTASKYSAPEDGLIKIGEARYDSEATN